MSRSHFYKPEDPDTPLAFCELSLTHLKGEVIFWFIEIPWYRLNEDVVYKDESGFEITIRAGYEFNGLSVPWVFWWLCPPGQSSALPAALIHDYFYQFKLLIRSEADRMFYNAMIANGYYRLGAIRNWLAVRLFGWMVY
jgi:hypothetical protein